MSAGDFRGHTAFDPQPQAVEAPGRGPTDHPTKAPVEHASQRTEADAIVVPGEKADPVAGGDIFPIAGTGGDQRFRILGPELERRGPLPGGVVALPRAFASAFDSQTDADSRCVQELLSSAGFTGKIVDIGKAQVPALM